MPFSSDRLTVLMLTSSYPRYEGDTASIFLRQLAKNVANTGVNIHVLAPSDLEVRGDIHDSGVEVHYFRYFPKKLQKLAYRSGMLPNVRRNPWLILQIPFFVTAMLLALGLKVHRLRPDVVHAHWIIPAGFVAVVVGRLLKVPIIVTAHGSDAFGLNGGVFRSMKNYTIKKVHAWTANTIETARAVSDTIPRVGRKLHLIPMGVDVKKFASGDGHMLRRDLDKHKQLLLFVGRIVKSKGVRYLIEAVAILKERGHSEIEVWIVGDGDEMSSIKNLTYKLGVEHYVRFLGSVPNEELTDYYAAADLFVTPSLSEGQGVTVIEAMAAGTPVIASNVGGIASVIKNGETGYLISPGDSQILADQIEKCVSKKNLDLVSASAAKKVKKEYDWRVVSRKFGRLYRTQLNEFRALR